MVFVRWEAERLPYERTGGWADSPGGVVRIGEVLLRQSLRLPIRADTSLYTREARGAAAPEGGIGRGGRQNGGGRSMIAPTFDGGNVADSPEGHWNS